MNVAYKVRFKDGAIYNVVKQNDGTFCLSIKNSLYPLSEFDENNYEVIQDVNRE